MSVALVMHHAKRVRLFYCHLWPVWHYNIFPHDLTHGTIIGKSLLYIKCAF